MAYATEHVPHVKKPETAAYHIECLLPFWTGKKLSDVKASSCREFVSYRITHGVSEHTARHHLETLQAAINYYNREYQLDAVPVVTLPKKPPPKSRWMTRDEVAAMLHATRQAERIGHIKRFIMIGVYSGTRSGAMLSLKWIPSPTCGWIDVDGGVIHRKGTSAVETKKRQPPVKIHVHLWPFLKRWRDQDMDKGITTVCHFQGKQVASVKNAWKAVCKIAGIKDVTPHTLRHTACTWQMQAGTDIWAAAGFLGMSAQTLEKVYGHHHPNFQSEAASAQAPKRKA